MEAISNQPLCLTLFKYPRSLFNKNLSKNHNLYHCFILSIKGRVTWPNSTGNIVLALSVRTFYLVVWALKAAVSSRWDRSGLPCFVELLTWLQVSECRNCVNSLFKNGYKKPSFLSKSSKFRVVWTIWLYSLAYGTNIFKGMYGETLDFQCQH